MIISIALLLVALFSGWQRRWNKFSFPLWVLTAVAFAYNFPDRFVQVGSFQLSTLIIPILMVIMFGMGSTLSINDFKRVLTMPGAVLVGLVCQFSIMPVIGFTLVKAFSFPDEIAAGVILVGCSPSGLASNVMSFISKANVALSITLTATATLLSPLLTPLLMKLLADQYIAFSFLDMLWSIARIVIIPVLLGLIYNHYLHGKLKWLDLMMPKLSMIGIVVVIAIIMAAGQSYLQEIGLILLAVVVIHNLSGYLVGFSLCRLIGMETRDCRTIAFEVGMQNSGLASGIAVEMGKIATMGLPAVIFGPVMNVSGSLLAGWWKNRQ